MAAMYEIVQDRFYEVLQAYSGCCVDYCLLKGGQPYRGEDSHREAVLFAIEKSGDWERDISKAKAERIATADFLAPPATPCLYESGGKLSYWRAFLAPPHGISKGVRGKCGPEDFQALNAALFPNGTRRLEVYEWSTDWSDYFDDGHEWWGAACWSAYDFASERYAVVMASATD